MKNIKSLVERATQRCKSLAGANLEEANLAGAYLVRANLAGAYLAGANLTGANLEEAILTGANLTGANLAGANLAGAYLVRANLAGAYLVRANLAGAYLVRANLTGANLAGARLAGAYLPSPTMILSANWDDLSTDVTIALMRLDASGHPDPTAFDRWAAGGKCPYRDVRVQRVANFTERRKLWSPGPPPTLWEAMSMVLDEKCPGWREKKP